MTPAQIKARNKAIADEAIELTSEEIKAAIYQLKQATKNGRKYYPDTYIQETVSANRVMVNGEGASKVCSKFRTLEKFFTCRGVRMIADEMETFYYVRLSCSELIVEDGVSVYADEWIGYAWVWYMDGYYEVGVGDDVIFSTEATRDGLHEMFTFMQAYFNSRLKHGKLIIEK